MRPTAKKQLFNENRRVNMTTLNMNCVRIGFGKIARIHDEQLRRHGVKTVGIIEVNPDRKHAMIQAGFQVIGSLQEAIAYQPDFYDICTPTQSRVEILRTLCTLDPYANILIEKPICDFKDTEQVRTILKNHKGCITVNENYASSHVTKVVQEALVTRGITPSQIIIESTKNRGADFLAGRYIDARLGALGYEGSHLFAIIGEFGAGYEQEHLIDSDVDNIDICTDALDREKNVNLTHQGGAFMRYQSKNGCLIDLYSSMAGRIGYPCPPYAINNQIIALDDTQTRYRILRADGLDSFGIPHQIIGLYEPVKNLNRSQGILLVFKNWVLQSTSLPFEDNTMSQHLLRAMHYFQGSQPNPYDFERGLSDVMRLNKWAQTCWSNTDDSEIDLGSDAIVQERHRDALRFRLN